MAIKYKIKVSPKHDCDGEGERFLSYWDRTACSMRDAFEDGAAAAAVLKQLAPDYPDHRLTIVRIAGDEDWREREQRRFDDGTYLKLPWHDEPWYQERHRDLFAHYSSKKSGMVSYTQDERKGEADLQASAMAPGRFLSRFFALSDAEVERWCAVIDEDCGLNNALHITQDADEIESVYKNGPSSCMTFRDDQYRGPCHPARVYAGPDLAVAYLGTVEAPTSRAVVWPDKKIWARIYGDEYRMEMALEREGYRMGPESFEGARLQRIEAGVTFVVPYLDVSHAVEDTGRHLVISSNGHLAAQCTDGLAGSPPVYCDGCNRPVDDEADMYHIEDVDEYWCAGCTADTWLDWDGNRYASDEDLRLLHGGLFDGEFCHEQDAFFTRGYCEVTAGSGEGELWHEDYTFICEDCGAVFHIDDRDGGHHVAHVDVCTGCGQARADAEEAPELPLEAA
jgi:hypothetical protein